MCVCVFWIYIYIYSFVYIYIFICIYIYIYSFNFYLFIYLCWNILIYLYLDIFIFWYIYLHCVYNVWAMCPWAVSVTYYTSSTAQGGVGSFKNRKPIREVGCCESRMAERIHWWTEKWLELWFFKWLQWFQWSPHPQLLDVVWCSAVVLVAVL